MSDDDPLTSRTITTPKATIQINGDLSHVDTLYRQITHDLLATGKYTIPPPGSNPWEEYQADTPVQSPDFLRRRLEELTHQIETTDNRELVQDLSVQLREEKNRTTFYREAFLSLNELVISALSSLRDDPSPTLYTHVAISFLETD